MKRSRIWLICILLALLVIPVVAVKLAAGGKDEDQAQLGSRSQGHASVVGGSAGNGEKKGRSENRRPVDYAAKAASMLELRAGEVGILPIPADFLEDVPGEDAGPKDAAQLRGVMGKKNAQDRIEKALRQGKPLQAKVGEGSNGVDWKGADLQMRVSLAGEKEGLPELLVESSVASGETWKHSVQLSVGSCAILRYPSGESVLIVIGGGPAGAVTKEEQ